MFSAALRVLSIKDLKDLSVFFDRRDTIDMQDLKDLKRRFSRERSRGTGPRATVCKAVSVYRRARACPSPCLDREGNGLSLRAFFAQIGRSRGTGPRATVGEAAARLTRSGSGDPELRSL